MENIVYDIRVAVPEARKDYFIARMDSFGLRAVEDEFNTARMSYDMQFEVNNEIKTRVITFLDEEGFGRWITPKMPQKTRD